MAHGYDVICQGEWEITLFPGFTQTWLKYIDVDVFWGFNTLVTPQTCILTIME